MCQIQKYNHKKYCFSAHKHVNNWHRISYKKIYKLEKCHTNAWQTPHNPLWTYIPDGPIRQQHQRQDLLTINTKHSSKHVCAQHILINIRSAETAVHIRTLHYSHVLSNKRSTQQQRHGKHHRSKDNITLLLLITTLLPLLHHII